MEFSQIFKAPSIPKIGRGTFSSSIFRGAAKLNSPIRLNRTRFSFAGAADPISAASIAPSTDALFETNRILVEIQKQLAYDFANRIAQEEEQIKLFKKEKEKKERISKEKSIEGIGKVGKTITGIFGFVTKPIKSIFDKIKEFFSIIITGIVVNNVFKWLENPENREKIGKIFGFLVEHWKIFAGILVGGLALRALYKVIRLVRSIKSALRFLRLLPQKPKGSPGVGQEATRGGLFRSAAGGRRGISTEAGTLRGPDRYSPYYKPGTGPIQQYQRSKTPVGRALQGIEVGFQKTGSNIMKAIGMGPGAKGIFKFLRPIFKRIPFVGALLDFAVSLALGENPGRAAARAAGALLGGALGSFPPLIPFGGPIWGSIVGDLIAGGIYDSLTKGKSAEEGESSKDVPELALGGKIKGKSHAAGGVPLLAEGGEFIVRKQEVPKFEPLLKDINENGGRLWEEFVVGVRRQKDINDMSFATVNEFEELLAKYKEIVKEDEKRLRAKQAKKGTGGGMGGSTRMNTSNISNLVGSAGIQQPQLMMPQSPSYNVNVSPGSSITQTVSPISIVPFSTRDLKPVKKNVEVINMPPIYLNNNDAMKNLKMPTYNTGRQEYPTVIPYDVSNEYLNKSALEYDIDGLRFGGE